MIKESKTKNFETMNKNDITKMTTIDNSNIIDQSGIMDPPQKYYPLNRQDFNMGVIESWTEIRAKKQPKRRCFHSSFVHEDYLYVCGGIDLSAGKLKDIKRIKLASEDPEWQEIIPVGVSLEPLAYHAGCLYENSYFIFGGQGLNMKAVNTVFVFDIENKKMDKLSQSVNDFPPLENHTANLIGKLIIIFGGYTQGVYSNALYSFDVENKTFKILFEYSNEIASCPEGRVNHSSLVYNENLYIFGGKNKEGVYLNDMWSFDLKTNKWSKVEYKGQDVPAARSGHSFTPHGDHFVIFGGKAGNMNEGNDLWKFDPRTNTFSLIHDTLLEKYTEKELQDQRPSADNSSSKNKTFRLLTKKDIPALNPLPRKDKNQAKKKKKEMMRKSQQMFEFRANLEKELLKSPNTSKMKRSIIYNLDTDMTAVMGKFSNMFHNTRTKSATNEITSVLGVPPTPRDGHSAFIYNNSLIVFGGDRNKFPLNDLFTFQL